jgi:glycosyltransferase involved in cell wall biosynthesis
MRICYLIPEFPGQTHAFFWREAHELKKLGVELSFVSTRRPPDRIRSHSWTADAQQVTTYLFPIGVSAVPGVLWALLLAGPIGWGRALKEVWAGEGPAKRKLRDLVLVVMGARLVAIARQQGCDHVHAHSCADSARIAMFASRLRGLNYSMSLHGPVKDYGPNQPGKWRHARFAIVITRKLFNEVHEQLAGHLPPAVRIAPMGVELSDFHRATAYKPYRGEGEARLFSCGRLNRIKGHAELIRAVAKLTERGHRIKLEIAGEDEKGGTGFRRELEQLIDELGVGSSVELLGAVDESRVRRGLEEAHVFALASYHEPLGVAIMEAMAMQTPVVSTRQGGVKELVDEGVDGLLVDAKRVDELADAIERVLSDPGLAMKLSQASRSKIEQGFHSGVSAQMIYELVTATGA